MTTAIATRPATVTRTPYQRASGFTLLEVLVVIAIVAILATLAVPSFQDRIIRAQVVEGHGVAQFARDAVAKYYTLQHKLPADNAAAGLPPADRIVGNYVKQVTLQDGALHIQYGNQVNRRLAGKTLTVRPAVVDGYPQVPIAWVCGQAPAPDHMAPQGTDQTDVPANFLPFNCRSAASAK